MPKRSIVVAGAGVFGTALAQRLSWNEENAITLYTIEEDVINDINTRHQNTKYFPGRHIHTDIVASGDIACTYNADVLFLAIPSKVIETFCSTIHPHAKKDILVVNLSKGLAEDGSFLTEQIPFRRTGTLKGPTFAVEVMNGDPSGMTFGGTSEDFSYMREVLKETGITLDHSEDIRAVEFLSVLKNMYAIAIGIVSGRYNSPNVDFLLMTKAVGEMRRMLVLYGCEEKTIFNYCGLGDLGLTALNDLSRNRTLGLLIGKGFSNNPKSTTVIEGLRTIKLLGELVQEKGIEDDFVVLKSLYSLIYRNTSLNDYYLAVLS
ncbi:NAD(P)H-dependent glycerol-3-phosphate dehydrogenase [Pleomorphochaeta sp. DL1XJH-081]|uniref:NAD(P)H-dependent glycerol-3-phosphate dehydrogenase n=1 Tax=Pleomorphochaeta sp. DL1XJH-081 TaxID=3409690 RepID=UPI003BB5B047